MKFPDKVVDLCKLLDENKAQDILVCDSTKMQNSVDYFIIATATSNVHIRGVVENISEKTNENKEKFGNLLQEGFGLSNWVVLSYENVFLHLFTKEERIRYSLEKLLNDGKNVTTFKRLLNSIRADEKKLKLNLKKEILKEQKEKKNEDRSQKNEDKLDKKEKENKIKKEKNNLKEKKDLKEKKEKNEIKENKKTEKLSRQAKRQSDK